MARPVSEEVLLGNWYVQQSAAYPRDPPRQRGTVRKNIEHELSQPIFIPVTAASDAAIAILLICIFAPLPRFTTVASPSPFPQFEYGTHCGLGQKSPAGPLNDCGPSLTIGEWHQSSRLDPCCHLHEWPVVLLRDGMKFFAHAAFLPLRVHAV